MSANRAVNRFAIDHFHKRIGETIVQLRTEAGLTRQDLARRSKLMPSTIQNAEDGGQCSLFTYAMIAEGLDVTTGPLIPLDATP